MACGLITGVIVWMVLAEHGVLGGIVGGIAGLAAWWLESQLWPWRNCWWCRGKPRVSWAICSGAWRECRVCGGRGKARRMLAVRR